MGAIIDELARAMARGASRKEFLKLAGAAVAALLLGDAAAEAKKSGKPPKAKKCKPACSGDHVCQDGQCVSPTRTCDSQNCGNGCCTSSGICFSGGGSGIAACGLFGKPCTDCTTLGSGARCEAGECVFGGCDPPCTGPAQKCCPNPGNPRTCRDIGSDPKNCGECGKACAAGETCLAGQCCGGQSGTPCGIACCKTGEKCFDFPDDNEAVCCAAGRIGCRLTFSGATCCDPGQICTSAGCCAPDATVCQGFAESGPGGIAICCDKGLACRTASTLATCCAPDVVACLTAQGFVCCKSGETCVDNACRAGCGGGQTCTPPQQCCRDICCSPTNCFKNLNNPPGGSVCCDGKGQFCGNIVGSATVEDIPGFCCPSGQSCVVVGPDVGKSTVICCPVGAATCGGGSFGPLRCCAVGEVCQFITDPANSSKCVPG